MSKPDRKYLRLVAKKIQATELRELCEEWDDNITLLASKAYKYEEERFKTLPWYKRIFTNRAVWAHDGWFILETHKIVQAYRESPLFKTV